MCFVPLKSFELLLLLWCLEGITVQLLLENAVWALSKVVTTSQRDCYNLRRSFEGMR
jgi:hypothetical protein